MRLIQDDIAIVGMAGLFPGAPDAATFWGNIVAGRVCISDHPAPDARRYLDPAADEFGRVYTIRGGYLGDLARFDPLAFGIMPNTVAGSDPDHYLSLAVAQRALQDAGYTEADLPAERTDVVIAHGTYINPGNVNWLQQGLALDQALDLLRNLVGELDPAAWHEARAALLRGLPPLNAQSVPALIPNIIAGRIANRLNLMGANYIVDGACSSSLIAVGLACDSLRLGRCDLALVGGVQAVEPIQNLMPFCRLGALSRASAPRPFDHRADGTMLGEGVGMLALCRRQDAERAGRRIYANIRAVGVASDGRLGGLLAPQVEGEALAIRRAYGEADVDPASVELVEAHATGIPLGDATELQALARVFGPRRGPSAHCAIGSVKSMIGHCIPAAGLASIIKTALALHHKVLPPTAGFEKPHPTLPLEGAPFYVNTLARPWVHTLATPRRAGVGAMGFGGINAHCILEESV